MVNIVNGDCLEILKDFADESIDCVVTDCPYRIVSGGVSTKRSDNCSGIFGRSNSAKWVKKDSLSVPNNVKQGKLFDHNDIQFSDWLPDVFRILKDGTHCYIMINSRNLKELQTQAEKVGFKFVNLLAWRKNNKTPNRYYMQQMEFILLLRKGKARSINNMGTGNCLDVQNIIGKKTHPTEKPVELMQILIENSTNAGDMVCDPFMGTGSTAIACLNTGRRFVGIEIDQAYFETAKTRIFEIKKGEKTT